MTRRPAAVPGDTALRRQLEPPDPASQLARARAALAAEREEIARLLMQVAADEEALAWAASPGDPSRHDVVPFVPVVALPEGPIARPDVTFACILDQFSNLAFGYEVGLADLTPADWRERLASRRPDLLLVESAWRGTDDSWRRMVSSTNGVNEELRALVEWCRGHDIPTVFWNKEDPANFEHFSSTASLFDYIFTTAEECIPEYRRLARHDRIDVLPFAAAPRIHNPVQVPGGRSRHVAFAGTYYARKHPERKVQMEIVLDPAREFSLEIFSRVEDDPAFMYPEKYRPHIVGSLPYPQLLAAHKQFRVFLNVNSVTDSRTMCARRIFELLASGASVVSGPSLAIEGLLGPGLVWESASKDETREALTRILSDDDERERHAVRSIRAILGEHTYGRRAAQICRAVGIPLADDRRDSVAAVASVSSDEQLMSLFDAIERQSIEIDEMVVVTRGIEWTDVVERAGRIRERLAVVEADEWETCGASLRRAIERVRSERVALFDPEAFYAPHYLEDALNAFVYTDAQIVGKASCYVDDGGTLGLRAAGVEYRDVPRVHDASLVFTRSVADQVALRRLDAEVLGTFQRECRRAGLKIFATDRFNFVAPPAGRAGAEGAAVVAV